MRIECRFVDRGSATKDSYHTVAVEFPFSPYNEAHLKDFTLSANGRKLPTFEVFEIFDTNDFFRNLFHEPWCDIGRLRIPQAARATIR